MPRFVRRLIVRTVLLTLAVGAVLLVVKVGVPGLPFGPRQVDRSQAPVLRELVELEEFVAAEGTFDVVVDLEDSADGVPVVLVGERTTMTATGTVQATVDFAGIDGDAVKVDGDEVSVRLPAPVLGGASIDHGRSVVTARERGLLTRLGDAVSANPTDDSGLYRVAVGRIEAAAAGSDLVARAEGRTRETLTGLLGRLGFERVTVEFDEPKVVAP